MSVSKLEKLYNKYWNLKFSMLYPQLDIRQCDTKKLLLVLGVGRSGTTWIGKTLATTSTPIRYFEEPLYHIKPKLNFSSSPDHTAINYCSKLSPNHRLYTAYKLFTTPKYDWRRIGIDKFLKRNTDFFKYCLIKEVHGLLATKALLTELKIRTIIVIRDPIYITDSIFAAQKISSLYLINETKMIRGKDTFLRNNFPNNFNKIKSTYSKLQNIRNPRKKKILETALTVAVLTKFLQKTATENTQSVYLIKYEKLCLEPKKYFSEMAEFLDLEWDRENEKRLAKTINHENNTDKDPYSIFKNTQLQINRPLKFLTEKEATSTKKMLIACGLSTNEK